MLKFARGFFRFRFDFGLSLCLLGRELGGRLRLRGSFLGLFG